MSRGGRILTLEGQVEWRFGVVANIAENHTDIDGKVYFNAAEAMQGEYYKVFIESADSYDLYGRTEDYQL